MVERSNRNRTGAVQSGSSVEPTPASVTDGAGLFRATIAGPRGSLVDAFRNLDQAPGLQRLIRHPRRDLIGARIRLRPEEGDGYWDLTQIGDNVFVIAASFAYKDPRVEFIPGDGLIQFFFNLSGDLTLAVSRTEPLRFNRPSLLVYSHPPGIDMSEWTSASAKERFIAITLRSEYLIENFLNSVDEVPPQLRMLLEVVPGKIQYSQLPLTTQMFETATRMIDNPHEGVLALIHTEAHALELLCATVSSFGALANAPRQEFNERDLRRLHAARSYLMRHLAPAPTIRQVARAVGLNETSLKRGFKAVFGETIFDFSVRCRMQRALMLLRERRMPVKQVAESAGYRHQTSFATAFRRHFGFRPKDIR